MSVCSSCKACLPLKASGEAKTEATSYSDIIFNACSDAFEVA